MLACRRGERGGELAKPQAPGNPRLDDFWAPILLLSAWNRGALRPHPRRAPRCCGSGDSDAPSRRETAPLLTSSWVRTQRYPCCSPHSGCLPWPGLQAAAELSKLHFEHSTTAAGVLCWQHDSCSKGHLLLHPRSWGEERGEERRSRGKGKLILTTAASCSSKLLTPLLLGKLTPKSLGVSLSLPLPPRVSLR